MNDNTDEALKSEEKYDQINCSYRIVLDPNLRTPEAAKVCTDSCRSQTIICTKVEQSTSPKAQRISKAGVTILPISGSGESFDWADLWTGLLASRKEFPGITSVLVEGGAGTWQTFRDAGIIDENVTLIG